MLKVLFSIHWILLLIIANSWTANGWASLEPKSVHIADSKKTKAYLQDGLVVGGDRAIDSVVIKDIRRAKNTEGERIVLDLEGTSRGEPAPIERPPYYQVAVNRDEGRLIVSVFGKPRLMFDAVQVSNAMKKSTVISGIELLPKVEPESWTFVMNFKGDRAVEVFELVDPVRIILDIRPEVRKKVTPEKKHH
jgi:hypothetical protein